MTQPSLFTRGRTVNEDSVRELMAALAGKGWVTAKSLTGWDERFLRVLASASEGRILGGQRGYCLTAEASVEDVQHCIAFYRSQAKAMELRAYQTERAMHQRRTA